jgi:hypothetical protein
MPDVDPDTEAALAEAVVKGSGLPHHQNPTDPVPEDLRRQSPQGKSAAEWAYDRLILYIRNFEGQLDSDQEIALGFAGSDAGVLRIEGLGFFEPDMITFYGRGDDGMKTQLIQHVAQLSVMLRAVPKSADDDAPRRIGFRLASGWVGGESGDGSA